MWRKEASRWYIGQSPIGLDSCKNIYRNSTTDRFLGHRWSHINIWIIRQPEKTNFDGKIKFFFFLQAKLSIQLKNFTLCCASFRVVTYVEEKKKTTEKGKGKVGSNTPLTQANWVSCWASALRRQWHFQAVIQDCLVTPAVERTRQRVSLVGSFHCVKVCSLCSNA